MTSPGELLATELGVDLDPELLVLALTHRSYAYEHGTADNERLEFLGDSVLGQAVTVMLYRRFPDLDEGGLARRRASLVSTVALARIARGIGLGEHVRLGRGEAASGGAAKPSILADTLEAVIGATYLSAGQDAATELVLALTTPLLEDPSRSDAPLDPKTSLQEIAARHGRPQPGYDVTGTGPDHDRVFTAVVTIDGLVTARGSGPSKKQAEVAAALAAWSDLAVRG